MKKIIVFDTETTSINKPFCYNIGFCVCGVTNNDIIILDTYEFMAKQVWYNTMLFSTAYFADKKELYHERIRNKFIDVKRWNEIVDILIDVIEKNNISAVYAYNSPFDVKVMTFMCDWFKTYNPFNDIPVFDIRDFFMNSIENSDNYKDFCENNQFFTDSKNYSTTAETAYRYIENDTNFIEEHTALADSEIETDILKWCYKNGVDIFTNIKSIKSIPRKIKQKYIVKQGDSKYVFYGTGATWYKKRNTLLIK